MFYIVLHNFIFLLSVDDGTGPDKIANIMGPPDRCEHAASIINELLQSIRVREEGGGVSDAQIHLHISEYAWSQRSKQVF